MYPNGDILTQGFTKTMSDGIRLTRMMNGSSVTHLMHDRTVYVFTLRHALNTAEQNEAIINFYKQNKYGEFLFKNPEDGETYRCKYLSEPTIARIECGGALKSLSVSFEGYINE